jgi:glutamate-1-semialdehyde 2,1-aminomutase/spore coat polysaccharide biosynthesis protein SpsF
MPVTAGIVQARMTSTRLAGKVLMPLAGKTVLWHVLTRCRAIPGADVVCCAVPDTVESEPVMQEAVAAGALVAKGPEFDVLRRYRDAAQQMGADVVMRVTSDCPVIDPGLCGQVLKARLHEGADYACNNMPRSWPHGLDCEAFTADALDQADREATDDFDREHVTPWLRRTGHLRRANVPGPGGAFADNRWTLDFPEDYAFFVALFEALPPLPHLASPAEIAHALQSHPEVAAINAARHVPVVKQS